MKTLICVLSLLATIAWTQELDLRTLHMTRQDGEHPAHGFGGFTFGSSKNYIIDELAKEGQTIKSEGAGWLWYAGAIEGCTLDFGYLIKPTDHPEIELMVGGIWEVTNTDRCYRIVEADLSRVYGEHFEMTVKPNGRIEVTREIRSTTIRHRKSDGDHSVWFFDARS